MSKSFVRLSEGNMCEVRLTLETSKLRIQYIVYNVGVCSAQGGSNFETIFSTRVFATIFSLFEMFVLTISSPYQKKESYVKV